MTTTQPVTLDRPETRTGARPPIGAGILVVIAGTVFADGAFLTAAYRGASPVSDDRLSYPWTGATALTTSVVWGTAQLLLTLGLVAFARSDAITGRAGRRGAWVAVAGSALYVLAHAVSIPFHDADLSDGGAIVALTLFGVGTLLTAVGMVVAGLDVRRTAAWRGWHRLVPLALGIWMVVMMPLQFTPLLVVAVAVYAALAIAFGVAMVEEAAKS
jgi:heme/copper-type cytochrome/quinol oxidase subunit 1